MIIFIYELIIVVFVVFNCATQEFIVIGELFFLIQIYSITG